MYITGVNEIHVDSEVEVIGVTELLKYAGAKYGVYRDPIRGEHVIKVHKNDETSSENYWNGI